MADIALLKLIFDLLFLAALGYLGVRILKSEGPGAKLPQLLELESSLKRIISEAQQSGNFLNKELRGRQRDLEKVLFDLETVESRMNRTITSAEDRKGALEIELGKASELLRETSRLNLGASSNSAAQSSAPRAQVADDGERSFKIWQRMLPSSQQPVEHSFAADPRATAASQDLSEPPSFTLKNTQSRQRRLSQEVKTNIYGDPIDEPAATKNSYLEREAVDNKTLDNSSIGQRALAAKSSLSKRIEVTQQNPYNRQEALKSRLKEIYHAAEMMLRTGRDLSTVAKTTKLPLSELKMIEQMVNREKQRERKIQVEKISAEEGKAEPFTKITEDPRLGVLAQAGRGASRV